MKITTASITAYADYLASEERAANTISKYTRDVAAFARHLDGAPVTKEAAIAYKAKITATHAPASVNSMLAAINGFFAFRQLNIKIKPLKIQRRAFANEERELTRAEYARLLQAAATNERRYLLLQTICSTGIRVSELRHITAEAAHSGTAKVTNKGKTRPVFLPAKLKTALQSYCDNRGITSGSIFITASGKPLGRSNIWVSMKRLCAAANVAPEKVFPHNLRHLFARTFYALDRDLARLADILGHSDINTTRIYIKENSDEFRRRIDQMGLVM
jgi:site-specific recombinase XerD